MAPRRLLRMALFFYAALFLLALGWRTGLHGESLLYATPAAAARGLDPVRELGVGLAAAALVIALSHELTRRTRAGERLARALGRLLGPLSPAQCWALALASGLGEEAFFRGALQPRVGLLAASLLFGLAHFAPRRDLAPWTLFAVGAGFLLGGLYAATGTLLAPIVTHVVVNGVNLQLLVRRYGAPPHAAVPSGPPALP